VPMCLKSISPSFPCKREYPRHCAQASQLAKQSAFIFFSRHSREYGNLIELPKKINHNRNIATHSLFANKAHNSIEAKLQSLCFLCLKPLNYEIYVPMCLKKSPSLRSARGGEAICVLVLIIVTRHSRANGNLTHSHSTYDSTHTKPLK